MRGEWERQGRRRGGAASLDEGPQGEAERDADGPGLGRGGGGGAHLRGGGRRRVGEHPATLLRSRPRLARAGGTAAAEAQARASEPRAAWPKPPQSAAPASHPATKGAAVAAVSIERRASPWEARPAGWGCRGSGGAGSGGLGGWRAVREGRREGRGADGRAAGGRADGSKEEERDDVSADEEGGAPGRAGSGG